MRSIATLILLFVAQAILATQPANAAGLQGRWSGSGYINPSAGQRERVRCVVNYSRVTNRVFSVSARCASNSGSIRQTGEVLKVRNSLFVGDFYNQQFNVRGRVRVRVRMKGKRQTVTFSGDGGGGRLNLRRR